MYTLTEIEEQGLYYIELSSLDGKSKASICLNQGGRLHNFIFENIQILAEFHPSTYKDNYASSVLFPFANRIKDGTYTFNDSNYLLDCNEIDKHNALHGLVYNKTFICIDKVLTSNYGSVTLQYKDEGKIKGFPYKYKLELTYKLSKDGINLAVNIINVDSKSFPFTLGWHPYFASTDLEKSTINFASNTKYLFDNQQIISGTTDLDVKMPFKFEGVKLDDGYLLETNEIEFSSPEYHLKLTSTSKENFLQLYTSSQPNVIAIEPMTGAADSFNNKIGLKILNPKDNYGVEWNIAIQILTNKIKSK